MFQHIAILLDINQNGIVKDFKLGLVEEIEKFNLNPIGTSKQIGQCLQCAAPIEISLFNSTPRQDLKQDSVHVKVEPDLDYVDSDYTPLPDFKSEEVKNEPAPAPSTTKKRKSAANRKGKSNYRPSSCKICDKPFPSLAALRRHQSAIHPDLGCGVCSKHFETKAAFQSHILRKHKSSDWNEQSICHVCGRKFKDQRYLATHILKHVNPRPFECDLCGERKTSRVTIKSHIIEKHMKSKYRCEVCNPPKQFHFASAFRNHMNHHNKVKPHACNKCDKAFCTPTELKGHINVVHVRFEDRPKFPCSICSRILLTKESLAYHEQTHKDESERKWQCDSCYKSFASKSTLERHKFIHTDTRPFACELCTKAFRSSQDLKTHMRLHTGEKPYQCPLESCLKRFSDRGCFRSHLKVHENNLGISLIKYKNPAMNLNAD